MLNEQEARAKHNIPHYFSGCRAPDAWLFSFCDHTVTVTDDGSAPTESYMGYNGDEGHSFITRYWEPGTSV
jgi:hypothetical protein